MAKTTTKSKFAKMVKLAEIFEISKAAKIVANDKSSTVANKATSATFLPIDRKWEKALNVDKF